MSASSFNSTVSSKLSPSTLAVSWSRSACSFVAKVAASVVSFGCAPRLVVVVRSAGRAGVTVSTGMKTTAPPVSLPPNAIIVRLVILS